MSPSTLLLTILRPHQRQNQLAPRGGQKPYIDVSDVRQWRYGDELGLSKTSSDNDFKRQSAEEKRDIG